MDSRKRNDLTEASGITADLVMELGKYFSAQDMRKVQTRLTSAAREMRALTGTGSLVGRLGEHLSPEQRELLKNAAALLDSVKYNVEHAKERKARAEKARAAKRDLWDKQAKELVEKHFAWPVDTVAAQLRVLELYLIARAVMVRYVFMNDDLHLRKLMQDEPPRWESGTIAQWRQNAVSSLQVDLRYVFHSFLSWDLERTPEQRLEELHRTLEERREEILSQPHAAETHRIWSEALKGASFITSVLPSRSPTQ